MLIAIISDTHLPRAKRVIPVACVRRLQRADLIIHAGDLVRIEVLDELRSYGPVRGVHGNMDDHDVRAALPGTAQTRVGGATIAITHDGGPARDRLNRLQRRFPDADAVIFGHSHIPLHEQAPNGFQIFNPGSPTERRKAPHHTMGLARVDAGTIRFRLIELD